MWQKSILQANHVAKRSITIFNNHDYIFASHIKVTSSSKLKTCWYWDLAIEWLNENRSTKIFWRKQRDVVSSRYDSFKWQYYKRISPLTMLFKRSVVKASYLPVFGWRKNSLSVDPDLSISDTSKPSRWRLNFLSLNVPVRSKCFTRRMNSGLIK